MSHEEFLEVQEKPEAYGDLKDLRAAKAAEVRAPTLALDEARKKLGA